MLAYLFLLLCVFFFFFFYVKLLRLHAGLAGEIVFFYILQEKMLLGNNPVGGH